MLSCPNYNFIPVCKKGIMLLKENHITHFSHILLIITSCPIAIMERKQSCSFLLYPFVSYVNCIVTLLINHNIVASINKLHRVLQMFHYYSTMYTIFRVYCPDTHRTSMGSCLFGFSSGAAVLRPNILWSPPPIQKSTTESTWMVFPSMP